jgi:hypothetical protein
VSRPGMPPRSRPPRPILGSWNNFTRPRYAIPLYNYVHSQNQEGSALSGARWGLREGPSLGAVFRGNRVGIVSSVCNRVEPWNYSQLKLSTNSIWKEYDTCYFAGYGNTWVLAALGSFF